jgi:hypothetical protein
MKSAAISSELHQRMSITHYLYLNAISSLTNSTAGSSILVRDTPETLPEQIIPAFVQK